MSDHASFLAAIQADPDDDLPRLAYSDWLEERGFAVVANLIRRPANLVCWPQAVVDEPDRVRGYAVYRFEHIDQTEFMLDAREVVAKLPNAREVLDAIRDVLLEGGWEGDGVIQAMWLPPFVVGDTGEVRAGFCHGVLTWHVKQSNNGTSWIASPVELPLPLLLDQNEAP